MFFAELDYIFGKSFETVVGPKPVTTKTSHAEFNNPNTKYDQPISNPKY